MAYATGSVDNLSELLAAVLSFCQSEGGWTLSGDVLHRGDVYTRLRLNGNTVEVLGGTGIDGNDDLTGAGPDTLRIREFEQPFVFPATYHLHAETDPDEVYVWLNYAVDFWQYIAFGASSVAGLPGQGGWYAASQMSSSTTTMWSGTGSGSGTQHRIELFSTRPGGGTGETAYVHHDYDGVGWGPRSPGYRASDAVWELLNSSPNDWNGEAVLLPIQAWYPRASSTYSLAADLQHARFVRNDNIEPGQVLTFGPDQWKVYPFYRKDVSNRNAGTVQHSGTFACAVRYTPA